MTDKITPTLIAWTRPSSTIKENDTLWRQITQAQGTFSEKLCEYAGRVCYASEEKMGNNPDFVAVRLREGHEDIIEHGWASVLVDEDIATQERLDTPYLHLARTMSGTIISGNLRAWLQVFNSGQMHFVLPVVATTAPGIFGQLVNETQLQPPQDYILDIDCAPSKYVTLLGASYTPAMPWLTPIKQSLADYHASATFLLDGVSRALTHQLVRHRLASFSQQSQRYTDMEKANVQMVVPPAIRADEAASAVLELYWQETATAYQRLRALGIRKEDARFLLPNAATTKIVVTMSFFGWRHFLWLRALDKAAQWEIRGVAQAILRNLYALSPRMFAREWEFFQQHEDTLRVEEW